MLKPFYNSEGDIPDGLKDYYRKDTTGMYKLQVEGLESKQKVKEFRDKNIEVMRQNTELKEQLALVKDIDPAKHRELTEKLEEFENEQLYKKDQFDALKLKLINTHEEETQKYKNEINSLKTSNNNTLLDIETSDTVLGIATPAGANMKYIQNDMRALFSKHPETGETVMMNEHGMAVKNEANDGNLTMSEYLTKTYIPNSSLFQKSDGSGSVGNRGVQTTQKGIVDFNDINGQEISGDSLTDLSKGKIKST